MSEVSSSNPEGRAIQAAKNPPGPLEIASWLLRAAVFIHAVALFVVVFSTRQTQFGNLLFMELFLDFDDPYLAAVFVEKITVSLYLLAGAVVLFKPFWPLLLLMAGYAFLEAYSGVFNAGYRFSEWTIGAHALRIGVPLVLLIVVVGPRFRALRAWTAPVAAGVLRVLVASVFFVHGYQALLENPRFIDLIIGTFGNILNIGISESTAIVALKVIAVVDFCVALAVLVYPTPLFVPRKFWASPCSVCAIRKVIVPGLMVWLAAWGLLTAVSRMTTLGFPIGFSQYPELLVRASHVLGPLALWALFTATYRPQACIRSVDDAGVSQKEVRVADERNSGTPTGGRLEPAGTGSGSGV